MARGFRRFSTDALKILDELVAKESEPSKVSQLQMVKIAWTANIQNMHQLNRTVAAHETAYENTRKDHAMTLESLKEAHLRSVVAYEEARKDHAMALESLKEAHLRVVVAYEEARKDHKTVIQSYEMSLQAAKQSTALVYVDLLKIQGLNNTRGLFEYMQHKILDLYPETRGLKGSEATWAKVLAINPTLEQCLRQIFPRSANLPSHLVTLYQILSQHIHGGGKDLSLHEGAIEFERDVLSPEQCEIFTCLGKVVGVVCTPAPKRQPQFAVGSLP